MKGLIHKYRHLLENFFSLSILNGLNVLLPLVTLPYIIDVVGMQGYGAYSYIYVIIQYIILFCTYGFNFSATKMISQCRDDKAAVSRIYNAVTASKALIAVALLAAMLPFSRWLLKDSSGTLMLVYGLGMVAGDILTPVWLFQGMEKMKYMTIVNASSKILFTLLIFVLVRRSEDYELLILFNSFGYILAAILSLLLVRWQFGLRLGMPRMTDVKEQLKEGSAVFGSTFGMNLYRNANVFILKQFAGDEVVGVYSAVEKVIKGFQSLMSPAAQALFPHLSLRFKGQSVEYNVRLLRRIAFPFTAFVLVVSVCVYFFAPLISSILCGEEHEACVPLMRIMVPVILFGEINYLTGIVGLINMNGQKQFFASVLVTGVFSVIFVLMTAGRYGAGAAAWAMSLSEVLLFILCLISIRLIRNRSMRNTSV